MQESNRFPDVSGKKDLIKLLVNRLVEDLADDEVQAESTDLVTQALQVLEFTTPDELEEVHHEVQLISHDAVEKEEIQYV